MSPRLRALCRELGIPATLLRARGLVCFEEATELVIAERTDNGRKHWLTPAAASAWKTLKTAAGKDGIELFIVSAYRSVERQVQIFQHKLQAGIALEAILDVNAPPGFSEHHTGRAIDVSTPGSPMLEVEFEQTAAFAWLTTHAHEFGFVLSYPKDNRQGFLYEPWHWCFQD